MYSSRLITVGKRALSLGLIAVGLSAPNAHAIKKCKDADGNWHYGDVAVQECEKSKVTTLSKQGFVKQEQAAPKTEEELQAQREEEARLAEEAARKQAEEEEKSRILTIYQTEADIDRQLDNQVYSVDSSIAVHKVYLKGLAGRIKRLEEEKTEQKGSKAKRTQAEIDDARAKIEESKKELKALIQQKKEIRERFAREKELFRSLKAEVAS